MHKIRSLSKRLFSTGFFHIFGASTINKFITAFLSIAIVRILSKDDYGTYSYALNIASFFVIFNGLGATSALLQLCCEAQDDRKLVDRLYSYGSRWGIGIDIAIGVLIVCTSQLVPLALPDANMMLAALCLYPLFALLFELRLTMLRVALRNKEYARMTNVETILLCVLSLAGAWFWGAYGLIAGQYVAYLFSYVLVRARNPMGGMAEAGRLSRQERRDYWRIALISSLNIGLSQALPLLGVFLVGVITASEALVADYKVATTIPFALLFIPSALVTYIYPYFVKHKSDCRWTMKRYCQLTGGAVVVMGGITIVCFVLAGDLITLIFGDQYAKSAPAFQVMMIGFFLAASLRQLAGNLLVTQRKVEFNFLLGIVSLAVAIVLSLLLIPAYSTVGAAWAYTGAMAVGAVWAPLYYIRVAKSRGGSEGAECC